MEVVGKVPFLAGGKGAKAHGGVTGSGGNFKLQGSESKMMPIHLKVQSWKVSNTMTSLVGSFTLTLLLFNIVCKVFWKSLMV